MIKCLNYEQDIAPKIENSKVSLLTGNGFSSSFFSYSLLVNNPHVQADHVASQLFIDFDTQNFEQLIKKLEDAIIIANAFQDQNSINKYNNKIDQIKSHLINAIKSSHPNHRSNVYNRNSNVVKFLKRFDRVYTLNYDLLTYWINLENKDFTDGFGLGTDQGNDTHGPFSEHGYCSLYNIHGALYLFQDEDEQLYKAISPNGAVLDAIERIINRGQLPLYVAEGTSKNKLKKIRNSPYLNHCYEKLKSDSNTLVIYGHGASDSDEHIYHAIYKSDIKKIYFSVHQPDQTKLATFDLQLKKFAKNAGKNAIHEFFDSSTVTVW